MLSLDRLSIVSRLPDVFDVSAPSECSTGYTGRLTVTNKIIFALMSLRSSDKIENILIVIGKGSLINWTALCRYLQILIRLYCNKIHSLDSIKNLSKIMVPMQILTLNTPTTLIQTMSLISNWLSKTTFSVTKRL